MAAPDAGELQEAHAVDDPIRTRRNPMNGPHITASLVQEHRADLLRQAQQYRLSKEVRAASHSRPQPGRRPWFLSWVRRSLRPAV